MRMLPLSRAGFLVLLPLCALASGCATEGTAPPMGLAPGALAEGSSDDTGAVYEDNASYAGRSTYRCDDGHSIEVANAETAVQLGFDDGTSITLPASPADSRTRYVDQQIAFVFDGDEALFFRPKTAPATCRRKV